MAKRLDKNQRTKGRRIGTINLEIASGRLIANWRQITSQSREIQLPSHTQSSNKNKIKNRDTRKGRTATGFKSLPREYEQGNRCTIVSALGYQQQTDQKSKFSAIEMDRRKKMKERWTACTMTSTSDPNCVYVVKKVPVPVFSFCWSRKFSIL